jgi:hypothetical protein
MSGLLKKALLNSICFNNIPFTSRSNSPKQQEEEDANAQTASSGNLHLLNGNNENTLKRSDSNSALIDNMQKMLSLTQNRPIHINSMSLSSSQGNGTATSAVQMSSMTTTPKVVKRTFSIVHRSQGTIVHLVVRMNEFQCDEKINRIYQNYPPYIYHYFVTDIHD